MDRQWYLTDVCVCQYCFRTYYYLGHFAGETMKYSEIRESLKTGDLVLFSGKGRISGMIRWFTGSIWSHIGMVIRSKEFDMLLLWESTTLSKIKDIQSNTAKQGVQLVALSERINTYDGVIGIRRLENVCVDPLRMKALKKLRTELKDRPYEESKIELLKSAYDGPLGHNEEDLSSIFCSEMVAEAYQRMGLLSEDVPSNEYTPAGFGRDLKLEDGSLSEIIEVEVG